MLLSAKPGGFGRQKVSQSPTNISKGNRYKKTLNMISEFYFLFIFSNRT